MNLGRSAVFGLGRLTTDPRQLVAGGLSAINRSCSFAIGRGAPIVLFTGYTASSLVHNPSIILQQHLYPKLHFAEATAARAPGLVHLVSGRLRERATSTGHQGPVADRVRGLVLKRRLESTLNIAIARPFFSAQCWRWAAIWHLHGWFQPRLHIGLRGGRHGDPRKAAAKAPLHAMLSGSLADTRAGRPQKNRRCSWSPSTP